LVGSEPWGPLTKLPFEVPDPSFEQVSEVIDGDVGIAETSRAAVETLAPVIAAAGTIFG
jgi:hypothetical protein